MLVVVLLLESAGKYEIGRQQPTYVTVSDGACIAADVHD